ncbi:alkaline shock response membrane anchor protein AmaP [Brevibacillus ginsengisoli]|uniref:alkaline shock response membrane anchor protein AmaP n=1 Tax=Brevibacillus ginsengisoli TaxID=363854 RepID=UPI003CF07AE6
MNLFDRFILTIYSFALLVLSFAAIGVMLQLVPMDFFNALTDRMTTPGTNIPYLIVAGIFVLISIRFFLTAFTGSKKREEKAILQRGDFGEVRISLTTVKSIAERVARKVKGVRDLKTVVKIKNLQNVIALHVIVDGETPIPELTAKLQADVKESVETITGIDVAEVTVVISEVAGATNSPARRRVE